MPSISGTVYDGTGAPAAGRIVRAYRRDTGAMVGSAIAGTGAVIPGDPYWASVSLLLHCDGADNSVVFADSSPTPKSIYSSGAAKISNSQSKFGGGSLLLNPGPGATGDLLNAAPDAAYVFGTGDFTLELWLKTTTSGEKVLVDQFDGGYSWQWAVKGGKLSWYGQDRNYVLTSAASVNDNVWHHVAVTRASGLLRFFVDGAESGSATDTTNYTKLVPLGIGAQFSSRNTNYDFSGYIDEVRITKGVARYTANFTPPTMPFLDRVEIPATAVGTYTIDTAGYTGECYVIALDDAGGTLENDLILRTTPV